MSNEVEYDRFFLEKLWCCFGLTLILDETSLNLDLDVVCEREVFIFISEMIWQKRSWTLLLLSSFFFGATAGVFHF